MYRFILFIFLLFHGLALYAQKDSLEHLRCDVVTTLHNQAGSKQYKKILIACYGETYVRHFTDNLSTAMAKHYAAQQVTVIYEYLGATKQSWSTKLEDAIKVHQPEAVLLIGNAGLSQLSDGMKLQMPPAPQPVGASRQQRVRTGPPVMSMEMGASLLEATHLDKAIWRGQIYVSGNVGRKFLFEQMGQLMTDELGENNILLPQP